MVEHAPLLPSAGAEGMTDKTYLVQFKPAGISAQLVVAENAQIYDEHLVFFCLPLRNSIPALIQFWSSMLIIKPA
jgi:hypothetical protein